MNVILEKEKFWIRNLFKNEKLIRNFLYCYMNSILDKNNTNHNELIKRLEISKSNLLEEVVIFNKFLTFIDNYFKQNNPKNNNHYENVFGKKLRDLTLHYFEIITRSEFNNIFLKYYISSYRDLCPRKIINEERKRNFIIIDDQIKIVNNEVYQNPIKIFALKILEELQKRNKIIQEQKNLRQNPNLKYYYDIVNYNNLIIENEYDKDEIIFILRDKVLNIILKLPFNKIFHLDNFIFQVEVLGRYKVIEPKFEKNGNNKKLLLLKKVEKLLEARIRSISRLIYEDIRMKSLNNRDLKILDNNFLINVLIIFSDYLNNYNMIFKTSCNLCGKKLKYSYIEKCFFPPYYKTFSYKEFDAPPQIKYNEKYIPIFFHEDCFKKMGTKAI